MTTVVCVGITVWDLVFSVDRLPEGAGKHMARGLVVMGGGPAANAAAAIVALGGEARFVGAVGDDSQGAALVKELRRLGVDTHRIRVVAGRPSPVSTITVDDQGERSIVNYTDPRLLSEASPISESDLSGADGVLVDVRWPRGAVDALRWARSAALPGVVDFDVGPVDPRPFLESASHIVFSAQALREVTGEKSLDEGLGQIAGLTDAWLGVTDGAQGSLWMEGGQVHHHPGFPVEAIDTTGAGDVYHAAFALELSRGKKQIEDVIEFASAAAAVSCTRLGARAGIPRLEEVETFLKGQQK